MYSIHVTLQNREKGRGEYLIPINRPISLCQKLHMIILSEGSWESSIVDLGWWSPISEWDGEGKCSSQLIAVFYFFGSFCHLVASCFTSYLAFYNVSSAQFCRPVGGSSSTFILWVAHWHWHNLILDAFTNTTTRTTSRIKHHHHHLTWDSFYGQFSQRTKSRELASLYWPFSTLQHACSVYFQPCQHLVTTNFQLVRCSAFFIHLDLHLSLHQRKHRWYWRSAVI